MEEVATARSRQTFFLDADRKDPMTWFTKMLRSMEFRERRMDKIFPKT